MSSNPSADRKAAAAMSLPLLASKILSSDSSFSLIINPDELRYIQSQQHTKEVYGPSSQPSPGCTMSNYSSNILRSSISDSRAYNTTRRLETEAEAVLCDNDSNSNSYSNSEKRPSKGFNSDFEEYGFILRNIDLFSLTPPLHVECSRYIDDASMASAVSTVDVFSFMDVVTSLKSFISNFGEKLGMRNSCDVLLESHFLRIMVEYPRICLVIFNKLFKIAREHHLSTCSGDSTKSMQNDSVGRSTAAANNNIVAATTATNAPWASIMQRLNHMISMSINILRDRVYGAVGGIIGNRVGLSENIKELPDSSAFLFSMVDMSLFIEDTTLACDLLSTAKEYKLLSILIGRIQNSINYIRQASPYFDEVSGISYPPTLPNLTDSDVHAMSSRMKDIIRRHHQGASYSDTSESSVVGGGGGGGGGKDQCDNQSDVHATNSSSGDNNDNNNSSISNSNNSSSNNSSSNNNNNNNSSSNDNSSSNNNISSSKNTDIFFGLIASSAESDISPQVSMLRSMGLRTSLIKQFCEYNYTDLQRRSSDLLSSCSFWKDDSIFYRHKSYNELVLCNKLCQGSSFDRDSIDLRLRMLKFHELMLKYNHFLKES